MLDGGLVDYSLHLSGKAVAFVEAKPFSDDLGEKHNKQAISYGKQEDIRWVIISNGRFLKIFDVSKGNHEKDCLLSEIDLRNLPNKLDDLMLISRKSIIDGKIEKASEDIFSLKIMINKLKSEKDDIRSEIEAVIFNYIGQIEKDLGPIIDIFIQQIWNSLEKQSSISLAPDFHLIDDTLSENTITRSGLKYNNEDEVIICPSKQDGIDFLKKYNAWGFVTLSDYHSKTAKYLAVYISDPVSSVKYFGEILSVSGRLKLKDEVSWINENDLKEFNVGKRLIILKPGSFRLLNDPIPVGLKRKGLQGKIYSSIGKFVKANNLDEL